MGVADYLRYFPDKDFARAREEGLHATLDFFERHRRVDGLIGASGFWNFTDWAPGWPNGCSDRKTGEPETILNLFHVMGCRSAAEVTGDRAFLARAEETLAAVRRLCWDEGKRLLCDVPGRPWHSVHAHALGILTGCVDEPRQAAEAILRNRDLTPCSLYFDFYVLEAMRACRHVEGFRKVLGHWESFVRRGDTTFPETTAEDTRSHCHGWSAAPVYHLLRGFPAEGLQDEKKNRMR